MGKEVETSEEPEAAYLRGVLRRFKGILERMQEQGAWKLSAEGGYGEMTTVLAEAMRRPATNGQVIDELYAKVSALEADKVDQAVDREILSNARTEVATLRTINANLQADVKSLRARVAQADAAQAGAIDIADDAKQFLVMLAQQIEFLAEHGVPLKPEMAKQWSPRLRALGGKAST